MFALRSCWTGGGAEGQSIRFQRDLLRPIPVWRDGASPRAAESQHSTGPALPQRLRHLTLQPQWAQPPSHQRLHHQTGVSHCYSQTREHACAVAKFVYDNCSVLTVDASRRLLSEHCTRWSGGWESAGPGSERGQNTWSRPGRPWNRALQVNNNIWCWRIVLFWPLVWLLDLNPIPIPSLDSAGYFLHCII